MKIPCLLGVASTLLMTCGLPSARAQVTRIKADNGTNLRNNGSWVGSVQPGSGDIAQWDSTVATATNAGLGVAAVWGQIKIVDPANAFTINSGSSLTLNGVSGVGIDMSTATQDFNILPSLVLGADQSWSVGTGRTLTIGGSLTGAFSVSLQGAGSFVKTSSSAMTLSAGSLGGTLTNTSGTITKSGAGAFNLGGNLSTGGGLTVTDGSMALAGAMNAITGAVSVNGGSLTLAGNNTLSGGVSVASGATINLNSANALGGSVLSVGSGSIIDNTSGGAVVLSGNMNALTNFTFGGTNNLTFGSADLSMSTNRTITLNGTNSHLILGGQIQNSSGGSPALTVDGAGNALSFNGLRLTSATNTQTTLTGTGNINVTGAIVDGLAPSGIGNFVYSGSGTLTLSGTNTYQGTTSLSGAGTTIIATAQSTTGNTLVGNADLGLGHAGALGSGTLIANNNAADFFSTVALTGVNAVQNAITLQSDARIRATASGGSQDIEFAGDVDLNGAGRLFTANSTGSVTTFSGAIGNDAGGGFTMVSTGAIVLGGASTFTGAAEFRGAQTVSVSQIGNTGVNGNLGAGSVIRFGSNSGTQSNLRYTGGAGSTNRTLEFNTTTGAISIEHAGTGLLEFTGTTTTTGVGAKTLTLRGSTTGVGEINGDIADNGGAFAVTKDGTGTWILAGNNSYTGATTVSGGTLIIDGSTAAASAVTVGSGGTLGGSGDIGGSVTVSSGGTLSPGNSPGLLDIGGDLTLDGGSFVVMELDGGTRGTLYDAVDIGGALTYGGSLTLDFGATTTIGSNYDLFSNFASQGGNFSGISLAGEYAGAFANNSGVWTYADGDSGLLFTFSQANGMLNVAAVPEPSTFALLIGAGLVVVVFLRRRRSQIA